ncbi:uncharacterized protein VP01_1979g1 [Puccinia sorghi]|uniref:No apical meristem-associated C-terminal domain-containing protein n=1 Tax=Puccinia sorghi TaxID=27349 RepID=A0A0L6VDJ9_9BASI|nr:uncharacterized protein VP01_1979g1 [Puccinia sorghi]
MGHDSVHKGSVPSTVGAARPLSPSDCLYWWALAETKQKGYDEWRTNCIYAAPALAHSSTRGREGFSPLGASANLAGISNASLLRARNIAISHRAQNCSMTAQQVAQSCSQSRRFLSVKISREHPQWFGFSLGLHIGCALGDKHVQAIQGIQHTGFKHDNPAQAQWPNEMQASPPPRMNSWHVAGLRHKRTYLSITPKRRTHSGITSQAVSTAVPRLIKSPKVYQTATMKFLVSTKVISNPPSGTTEANHIKFAEEEYYNNTQKLFVFESTWNILRSHEKWREAFNSKRKCLALDNSTTNFSSQLPNLTAKSSSQFIIENSSSAASPTGDETNRHPIGVKKAKRSLAFVRANILQEQSNLIQQVEAEMKAQQLEISIMEKDLPSLADEFACKYFVKKKDILFKMREREIKEKDEREQLKKENQEDEAAEYKLGENNNSDTSGSHVQPSSSKPNSSSLPSNPVGSKDWSSPQPEQSKDGSPGFYIENPGDSSSSIPASATHNLDPLLNDFF